MRKQTPRLGGKTMTSAERRRTGNEQQTTHPTVPRQETPRGETVRQESRAVAPSESERPVSGWLTFAGSVLVLVGAFNVIAGLTALFRADYFQVTSSELLVFNFGAWAWIWLALGVVQLAAGAGAMMGQSWARTTGIALATMCAIGHLAFLAAFPLWSVLVIAMSVLTIYALVVPSPNARAML